MQNQGMTSKTAVKVPKRKDWIAEGKNIKSAFNILIQVLEESSHIWKVFKIKLYGLLAKLFTFLLVFFLFISLVYLYLDLFPFLVLGVI